MTAGEPAHSSSVRRDAVHSTRVNDGGRAEEAVVVRQVVLQPACGSEISARSRPDLGQISASCRGSPSLEFDAAQERRGERRDAEVGEDDDGEGCGDDCLVRDMVRLTPLSLPPPSALQG